MPAGGSVIDSLLISLGFVADTAGLDAFKAKADEATSSLLRIGTVLTAAFTGLAVKAIADIGSTFEQNQIQIAGFLSGLGLTSDFNQGLKEADKTLVSITNAAAKLPGEAEEYVEVFKGALPFLKKAIPGGSIDAMTDFTNQMTAIGKATGGPSMSASQIARESKEMLADVGRAHQRNVLFANLLPFMQQVEGQAKLTDKSFNAMTAPKRVELMLAAFKNMKPMLDASADSFDAMAGAVKSSAKQMVRLSTVGIFKGMKDALGKLNAMFFNADGSITDLGKHITEVGQRVSRWVVQAVSASIALVAAFTRSSAAMTALKVVAAALGVALVGLAFERTARGVGMLLYSLTNLKRLMTGGLFLAIGLIAEDLYVFETGGESVTGMLVEKLGPAAKYISEVALAALASALIYVNRQAVATAFSLARPLLPLLAIGAAVFAVTKLWQHFGEKGHAAMVFVGAAAAAVFLVMKRAAIQTAIGFALMNLPLILIVGSLAALGVAIYAVVRGWDTFGAGAKTAIAAAAAVIGTLIAAFVATQAAAIASGAAAAAAWVAALGPIAIGVVAVGLLAVGLYELVHHWEAVTNAISDAVDATARFFHISQDASGRKGLADKRAAFDKATSGYDKPFRRYGAGDDDTSFLVKRGKKTSGAGGSPESPPAATGGGGLDVGALLKGLVGGGDGGGVGVMEAIAAAAGRASGGGASAGPPSGAPGFVTNPRGTSGPTVQHRDVHSHGDVKTEVTTNDPERVGRGANAAIIRNLDSVVDH